MKISMPKNPAWKVYPVNHYYNSDRVLCIRIVKDTQSLDLFDCEFFSPSSNENKFLNNAPAYVWSVILALFDNSPLTSAQADFITKISN